MLSIRDTISRIGRFAKKAESIKADRKSLVEPSKKRIQSQTIRRKTPSISSEDEAQYSQTAQHYQRHVFREFLEPLNIPNLKIFDDLQKYDSNKASLNWQRTKKNMAGSDMFLLEDRLYFEKMMDYLIKIIPDSLKGGDDTVVEDHRYHNFPSKSFSEIPPMPVPLTVESFQEYIYILTHTRFYYRNSSSLKSGLIPQILLYTHNVKNEEFSKVRSVHTYNYLIKFFGYDKNQSSFARELLLVMRKDGHVPNIDTINHLLKHCKTHSHIRSNTNTYQVILEYLRLASKLQVEINLSTFNRVYDAINNIFLRELFLTKMQLMNIPMSKHLIVKIVDDFAETTKVSEELVSFIESDLNHRDWKNDGKFANKIVRHRALHTKQDQLDQLWSVIQSESPMDEFTLKFLLEGVRENKGLQNKLYAQLIIYCRMEEDKKMENVVVVYQSLISELLNNVSKLNVHDVLFIVRGVMFDMVAELQLPNEVVKYERRESESESYKIIRTIIGSRFEELELLMRMAKTEPWLDTAYEVEDWKKLKKKLALLPLSSSSDHLSLFGDMDKVVIPQSVIDKHKGTQRHKIQNLRVQNQMRKLREGSNEYIRRQMKERGIHCKVEATESQEKGEFSSSRRTDKSKEESSG